MLFLGTLIEATSSKVYVAFPKEEWRLRLDRAEKRLPNDLPSDAVLFFSQLTQAPHIAELDAMWIAMKYTKPTLNGYSGNFPTGYQYDFGSNCTELPKRIMAYLYFTKQFDGNQYEKLMQRVVPIGFEHCDFSKFGLHPKLSTAEKSYSAEVFKKLHIRVDGVEALGTRWRIKINLQNDADRLLSAYSRSSNPIAISYRFLDANEKPITNWNPRIYLWADVPAHESLYLEFETPNETNYHFVELAIVQEGIFWSYDLGLAPKKIALESFGTKN